MSGLLIPMVLSLAAFQTAARGSEDPRAVVRDATSAVQGDSAPRLQGRLAARASRNANDRAALLGLATLSRLQYDYPVAETTYSRIVSGGQDRYAVYARLGLAEGFEIRSIGRAARTEFETALRAAREIRDRVAEGEALLALAFSRGRLEGVAVAEATLDSASHLVPETELSFWSGMRQRRAITHAIRGRPADALNEAKAGIALAARARDRQAEADAYRVLGQILQYRSQWDSAFDALNRSEALYLEARNRSALANSLIWHAQVLSGRGRYGEMREVMRRALSEGEATKNPGAIGDAHRAFGVLALMLGDWPAASLHLKQSAAISISTGDSSGVRTTRKYLANVALAAGDVTTAKALEEQRLEWALRTQNASEAYESYRALADIASRGQDWATAERALAGARQQLRQLPGVGYRRWLTHDEARLALARGDLTAAERLLRTYMQLDADIQGFVPYDARVRLADVYARRGDLERAERELLTATDEIDRWRAGLADAQLRTLAFQSAVTTGAASSEPAGIASNAARVFAALAAGGRAEAAFTISQRWRARELMDRLTRADALRAAPSQPASPNAPSNTRARSAVEVVAALPDERTALVEFIASKGVPLTVFVIQKRGIEARVMPAFDSLAERVSRFGALVESGTDAARLGRDLGSALLGPVLPLLDARVTRILIVPDGPLHHLPFDALRLADGRYVVERYAVGVTPSASVAAELWGRRPRSQSHSSVRILAFGNPVTPGRVDGTSRDAASEAVLGTIEAAGGLPRLEGAAREARLVARYSPEADVRLGKDASAAYLKRADLRSYRVLHFATHALVSEQSVAGTALALAPGENDSGFIGPGDLAALRLDADIVVLSACSAARGVIVGGEGVQGLTSPLLQAGARSIVATYWRINDRDVVPFVDAFYSGLARELPVIDALRDAKLAALKRGEPPRTWAAFQAIGDPLVSVPLRTPPRSWWSKILGRWR